MYKLEDIIQDLKHDTPEVSVLEIIECLEQAQDTISDLEAKVKKYRDALERIKEPMAWLAAAANWGRDIAMAALEPATEKE